MMMDATKFCQLLKDSDLSGVVEQLWRESFSHIKRPDFGQLVLAIAEDMQYIKDTGRQSSSLYQQTSEDKLSLLRGELATVFDNVRKLDRLMCMPSQSCKHESAKLKVNDFCRSLWTVFLCTCAVVFVAAAAFGCYHVAACAMPMTDTSTDVNTQNAVSLQAADFPQLEALTAPYILAEQDILDLNSMETDALCTELHNPVHTGTTDETAALALPSSAVVILRVCSWEHIMQLDLGVGSRNDTVLQYLSSRSSECVRSAFVKFVLPKCAVQHNVSTSFIFAQLYQLQNAVHEAGELWQCRTQVDPTFRQWITMLSDKNEAILMTSQQFVELAERQFAAVWPNYPCSKHQDVQPWNTGRTALLKDFAAKVEHRLLYGRAKDSVAELTTQVQNLNQAVETKSAELASAQAFSSAKSVAFSVAMAGFTLLARHNPYVSIALTSVSVISILGYEVPALCDAVFAHWPTLKQVCALLKA
jgi:hypothetical protein